MQLDDASMPAICHSTYIAVFPAEVYRCLTTAGGWDGWFTEGTEIDAREGGFIRLRWKDFGVTHLTMEDGGPVIEAVSNERFGFRWQPGSQATTVMFTLAPLGDGTLVEVTETGYPATAEDLVALVNCAAGWGEALTLMKFYLERGIQRQRVPASR
jgi:uncharacterized protein YndB with AHSA1/START domain